MPVGPPPPDPYAGAYLSGWQAGTVEGMCGALETMAQHLVVADEAFLAVLADGRRRFPSLFDALLIDHRQAWRIANGG